MSRENDIFDRIADQRLNAYLDSCEPTCELCGANLEDLEEGEEHDCYTRDDYLADEADRAYDER